MPKRVLTRAQFERDTKRALCRGKDGSKLADVIELLTGDQPLPVKLRDHPLKGEWAHHRDCHIEPDWILIYKVESTLLTLVRTGTHADLF